MKQRAKELLTNNTVNYFLGYKNELFDYDPAPFLFDINSIDKMVYNAFCGPNLSKTLFLTAKDKKVGVFLKPCDTYSFKQLLKENKFSDNNIYVIGVECNGKLDINKIAKIIGDNVLSVSEDYDKIYVTGVNGKYTLDYNSELFLDKCLYCKGQKHIVCDEKIIVNQKELATLDRFEDVEKIEKMSPDERFLFWQKELSRCIRCNACRNVCPACTCNTCVFDNKDSQIDGKVNANSFEEKLYHIIKSFHVAGRCTDCGECSRVCPEKIPLHLLNRKYIKEINQNFKVYQAGEDDSNFPLSEFNINDKEVK